MFKLDTAKNITIRQLKHMLVYYFILSYLIQCLYDEP